jgi:ankyrin repeat protein
MRKIVPFFLIVLLICPRPTLCHIQEAKAQPQPSQQTGGEFLTPLMRAAARGQLEEVRSLLKAGADVNEKDAIGLTALILAASANHVDVVHALLEGGADPNAAGGVAHGGFFSVLTVAMNRQNKNRLEMIDKLIASGAKLNPPNWFPESPVFVAVRERDMAMLKTLLDRRADVNWENSVGATSLVLAISMQEPDVEIVRLLIKAGANPNKPRLWEGDDCISILEALDQKLKQSNDKDWKEIRSLLKQAGAKKYSKNSHGRPCN